MRHVYTAEDRIKIRWFPKGSLAVEHPTGLGVAYVSLLDSLKNTWQVVLYRGSAAKPEKNYSFRNREQAERHVSEWFDSLLAHKAMVTSRRAEANAPTTLKPGDIITNSWGYDQTNIDCYQVTRVTEHFVWLRGIAQETTETGFMSGETVPKPNCFLCGKDGEERKHKATGQTVCMKYGSGSKWDGRKLHCSWYA
jgi:hypothetical protein